MSQLTIGIVGAGKIGTALARLALKAGHSVRLSSSGRNPMAAMIAETLAPGAKMVDFATAVAGAYLVILALPQAAADGLDWDQLEGRVVVDLMNAWSAELTGAGELATESTTQELGRKHPRVRLVKSLNHLGYDDLEAYSRPAGSDIRWGVLVASDDAAAAGLVADFVDSLGYDPVLAPASAGVNAEPGGPIFGRRLAASKIAAIVSAA